MGLVLYQIYIEMMSLGFLYTVKQNEFIL